MFAPKAHIGTVLACTSDSGTAGPAAGGPAAAHPTFRLPGGLACDRVWLQGTVVQALPKANAFWLCDGPAGQQGPRIKCRCAAHEALPAVDAYIVVIGRLAATSTGSSTPGPITSQGSESKTRGFVVYVHKVMPVLGDPARCAVRWAREVQVLHSSVYPLIVAQANLQRLKQDEQLHVMDSDEPNDVWALLGAPDN